MYQKKQKTSDHVPVMLDAVLDLLAPKEGEAYLDLTAGYGGHAMAVLAKTKAPQLATLIDRDSQAISYLQSQPELKKATIIKSDFASVCRDLVIKGERYDLILADLGVSSPHLNNAKRGFSFRLDGPLDMRMDQDQILTAETIVNKYDEQRLAKILSEYGEEPKARTIAKLIVTNRPHYSTTELAGVIARAWPGHSKAHPATRSFQAIRIALNDEISQIEQALALAIELLKPGGRIVVISFHSLEDRIVKTIFHDASGGRYDAQLELLTKKPIVADDGEIAINPRARSAKLRAAAKQK